MSDEATAPPPKPQRNRRRLVSRLLKIARNPWVFQAVLAVVLLGLAASQVSLDDLASTFRSANYAWMALAFGVYVIARIVHTWEWQITLTKVGHAPFGGLFGALLIGSLVNSVVPAAAGDVARVQIVANRYNLSRTGLITGRGAEAVVDGVILVVFLLISLALPAAGFGSGRLLWLMAAGTFVGFIAAAIGSNLLPDEMPAWRAITLLPRRVQDALRHLWPRVHAGLEVIRRPKLLAIAIVINLFGWMVDVLIFWAYGQAFGLDIPFSAYLSLTVAVAIVTIFPITFGNIGTYEFVLVRVMGLYGVSSDQALAYALGTHIVSTAFVIALGMIAMWTMGVTPSEIFSFKKPAKKAATAVESAGVP